VSRVLIALLFGLIVPVAYVFRLQGRDVLQLRRSANKTTYWTRKAPAESVRSYLRQF
jgi:hypothetical protein